LQLAVIGCHAGFPPLAVLHASVAGLPSTMLRPDAQGAARVKAARPFGNVHQSGGKGRGQGTNSRRGNSADCETSKVGLDAGFSRAACAAGDAILKTTLLVSQAIVTIVILRTSGVGGERELRLGKRADRGLVGVATVTGSDTTLPAGTTTNAIFTFRPTTRKAGQTGQTIRVLGAGIGIGPCRNSRNRRCRHGLCESIVAVVEEAQQPQERNRETRGS